MIEQTDVSTESFCDIRCWARWWDSQVVLTGDRNLPREPTPPWQALSWRHAQDAWGEVDVTQPGITRRSNNVSDYLIYRDSNGTLLGFVSRSQTGGYFVFVDPSRRREGIGKILMRAAGREWGVAVDRQNHTDEGYLLSERIDPREKAI